MIKEPSIGPESVFPSFPLHVWHSIQRWHSRPPRTHVPPFLLPFRDPAMTSILSKKQAVRVRPATSRRARRSFFSEGKFFYAALVAAVLAVASTGAAARCDGFVKHGDAVVCGCPGTPFSPSCCSVPEYAYMCKADPPPPPPSNLCWDGKPPPPQGCPAPPPPRVNH